MKLFLHQMYYAEKCSWFYIALMILSFGLVLITVIDGFQVADSPGFIVLELILNILIGVDFICRILLVGCKKYVIDPATGKARWWNIFDALVVIFCNVVFGLSLVSKSSVSWGFEAASEEILITMWCIWQTMRMILIAKKQRRARQSAKTLIDFENLIVDTDFGGVLSFYDEDESTDCATNEADEIIEMQSIDDKARLRSKINVKLGQRI